MTHWIQDAVFYHIYPLGFCGAPARNDFTSAPIPRLEKPYGWIDHLHYLGANALYLGPVFEASSHGYNTSDYYQVDRRLGSNDTLANLVRELHRQGIRVILDGVFNHVGRDFWAFRDLQAQGQQSPYAGWFAGLRFDQPNQHGDPFSYEGWAGHTSLVKLNLHHPDARRHLLDAARMWIETFEIDGLRLDAADCVDHDFLSELGAACRALKPDFWLLGEVVHGDYRQWANPAELDSVTNYECYKGLYSSFNERNFFEIAYALNRQFGEDGLYRGLPLYNFVDNHDVNRIASSLRSPVDLAALHLLLYSMPGVPSIYAGSEFGIPGLRTPSNDAALRPALDL
jgi:glycosidase